MTKTHFNPTAFNCWKLFEGESKMLGTFYFTHSEAVLPFVGLLGLYKDTEAPTHYNYEEMLNRKYRYKTLSRIN
jgi:hypothetical protein